MKQIKLNLFIILSAVMGGIGIFSSCTPMDDYLKYTDGKEIVYTGKVDYMVFRSGRERVVFSGYLISDPNIVKVSIYWNDRKDSLIIPVQRSEGIDILEEEILLKEGTYNFEVYTFNKEGRPSVPGRTTGKSYGALYESSLYDRPIKDIVQEDGYVLIEWYNADPTSFVELEYEDMEDDYQYFLKRSYNYLNLYNHQTHFFHPKDKDGNFIEPFDYRFSGGMGARDYYDENNGWTYRWDLQHNFADLVRLMGSPEAFAANLNATFCEPLGKSKFEFYAQLPDHTGNVGQFSMANEPSLHIPYLYNYAGQPWKTQKRIRSLLKQWFRNDLMGIPGDEDGGGTSAFVVFSAMGFYPVTPGMPSYSIGSPLFPYVKMDLGGGKYFEIEAINCSDDNKYVQSAKLNGKEWSKSWFNHDDIKNGGKLVLIMGNKANTNWGKEEAPQR